VEAVAHATAVRRASHPSTDVAAGSGGELLSQRSSEGRHYYLTNSLGSVVGLTDQDGTVANRYRYDPFGNTMNQGTEETVSNPFRFGGEFYDSQIKLYKQGLRFYDPRLGRWTQRDPLDQLTEPRQSNRYGFVGQDPVNLVDPSGAHMGEVVDRCFEGFLGTESSFAECFGGTEGQARQDELAAAAADVISTVSAFAVACASGYAGAGVSYGVRSPGFLYGGCLVGGTSSALGYNVLGGR